MKIKIINQDWKCRAYNLKTYQKHCGCDSVALCETDLKQITFLRDELIIETVIHELVHAYASALSFVELDLDEDQSQEFYCELFAKFGGLILTQGKEIYNYLTQPK